MEKRSIVRVQLTPPVKKKLDALCEKRGMTQISVMSRLVGWLCDQDDLIQAAVLGQLSKKTQAQLARDLLESMSKQ